MDRTEARPEQTLSGWAECQELDMSNQIFPKQFASHYRGDPLSIWLFGGAVLMELAMGVNSLVNTRTVATMTDGIPLDQYGATPPML
jgi:hypothetical protein